MKKVSFYCLILVIVLKACQSDPAVSDNPDDYVGPGDDNATIISLTEQLEADPENADLYFERAQLYDQAMNYEKAVLDMFEAMKRDSSNESYYYYLGDLFMAYDNGEKAIQTMQKAIQLFPENVDFHLMAGEYCLKMPQPMYQESIDYLNGALELDVFNPDAYFLKGFAYKENGDTSKAISLFQTCVEQDPSYYNAYMQLGLLESGRGNEVALTYFDNASRLDPGNPNPIYAKGLFLQEQERYQESVRTFKEVVGSNLQHAKSMYSLGYTYLMMDSIDQAYKHFNLAVNVEPDYTEAYYNRGLTLEIMGKTEQARSDYQQALNIDPEFALAQQGLNRLK